MIRFRWNDIWFCAWKRKTLFIAFAVSSVSIEGWTGCPSVVVTYTSCEKIWRRNSKRALESELKSEKVSKNDIAFYFLELQKQRVWTTWSKEWIVEVQVKWSISCFNLLTSLVLPPSWGCPGMVWVYLVTLSSVASMCFFMQLAWLHVPNNL